MNLLSLFSGIGAFEKALDNEGIKYNLVNYCEIDKYANRSYAAIHNISEELNLIDVTKVDTSSLSDIDLITYGFPCQDISQAGNQKGFTDKNGERTRSGLFFEALRIIKDLKPKYAIAENVKALTSKKFKVEFETVLSSLNDAGYNVKDLDNLIDQIKNTISIEKVLAIHINDSKNPIGAHKDRHENLGYGYVGFDAINAIVHSEVFKDIPKILETPYIGDKPPYQKEIEMLKNSTLIPNWKDEF